MILSEKVQQAFEEWFDQQDFSYPGLRHPDQHFSMFEFKRFDFPMQSGVYREFFRSRGIETGPLPLDTGRNINYQGFIGTKESTEEYLLRYTFTSTDPVAAEQAALTEAGRILEKQLGGEEGNNNLKK